MYGWSSGAADASGARDRGPAQERRRAARHTSCLSTADVLQLILRSSRPTLQSRWVLKLRKVSAVTAGVKAPQRLIYMNRSTSGGMVIKPLVAVLLLSALSVPAPASAGAPQRIVERLDRGYAEIPLVPAPDYYVQHSWPGDLVHAHRPPPAARDNRGSGWPCPRSAWPAGPRNCTASR